MAIDVEKIELTALDPAKCNVLVITLWATATRHDADAVSLAIQPLRDKGVEVILLPSGTQVQFGHVEPPLLMEVQ